MITKAGNTLFCMNNRTLVIVKEKNEAVLNRVLRLIQQEILKILKNQQNVQFGS